MKYYEELLRLRCFRLKEAAELTGSENAAMQVLRQYIEKGYVPISMKNDFLKIYPDTIKRSDIQYTEPEEAEDDAA